MAGLIHFVGFTLAEGTTPARIDRVRERVLNLVEAVDGAELLCVGPNTSGSAFARDWHYAAIVRLRDRAVLAAYLAHPAHAALSAETRDGFYDQCAVLDIEVPGQPAADVGGRG